MKPCSLTGWSALTLLTGALHAQWTPGNLVVLRVGDGATPLSNAAQPLFLQEYDPLSGAPGASVLGIPGSGASALTLSGTATSEGALNRSADGRFLTFAGYVTDAGTASVANTAANLVHRAVGLVDYAGTYTLAARTDQGFSANNVRGAVTVDGSEFWVTGAGSGGTGGLWHLAGDTDTQVYSTISNLRVPVLANGNLYFSTSSGTATRGVHVIDGGLPTTAGATATQVLATGGSSSPYDFAVSPDGDLIYVADDSSEGIQRWDLVGDTWTLSYTLGTGTAGVGARGLTVDWSAPDPVLFAITEETSANRLIRITDSGAGSAATTLATAGANTIFRGVDFAPVPEPAPAALLTLGGALWLMARRRAARSS